MAGTTAKNQSAVVVRSYPNRRRYEADARKFAAQGYKVSAVTERRHPHFWWEVVGTLGLINVLGPHRRDLLVTYNKE